MLPVEIEIVSLKPRTLKWQMGMSAYWFATSMKWFIMLLTLGLVVKEIVPGGQEGTLWGRVVMIGAIWAMVGPGLFGFLSDRTRSRFGRWKPYLSIGAGMTVVALMVIANAKEYWVIVVGYLLLQVSDDLATGPYSMLIPGLVPEEQRGRASGVMGLFQFSAQIVGGITAFILGDFKTILMTIAVVNVVCALITLISVKEDPQTEEQEKIPFFEGLVKPWKNSDFRWAWFTRFLNALGFYLIINYLALYLSARIPSYSLFGFQVADKADKAVFVLALLISLLAAIGSIIGGNFADKVGRKRVIYVSGAAMTVLLPPFALVPNFTVIALLAIFFGVAYGAYESSSWAMVSDVLPSRKELAKDMGIWQSSIATPQILSGLAGMAVDWGNHNWGDGKGYTLIFLFASVAYFFSTVLVKKIRGST